MNTFRDYFLHQQYSMIAELGDKLGEIKDLIDWEKFRPIFADMYHENEEEGGRPHIDEILMVKMLLLQGWYGLSDYEAERQANDRISFRHFLGYPDTIPDRSTLWKFGNDSTTKAKSIGYGTNSRDNLMKKGTGLNAVPFRMRHLSPQILATHRLTNLGGMRPGLVEVVTGLGARKDPNHNLDTNSIR